MDPAETFTLLPLTIDPVTKAVSTTDPSLQAEIEDLNRYSRAFTQLETPNQIPAPPAPVNPKRSVQITKLRESGNASYKKGAYDEALKFYDLAIKMAADRPMWEASGLVREELSTLYANKSQCEMGKQNWAVSAIDAECSVELKRVGNAKAWWRRAQSLREMGRFEEALDVVKQALDFERAGPDKAGVGELEALYKEIEGLVKK